MTFVILTVALGLGAATGAHAQPVRETVQLPDKARDALSDRWKTWSPSEANSAISCQPDGAGIGPFEADLDTDNHADYVLGVRTSEGDRLVALVYRPWGFELFDLDAVGGGGAPGTISIEPRGSRFTSAYGSDDYFPASTVALVGCDRSGVAFIWNGSGFRKTPFSR